MRRAKLRRTGSAMARPPHKKRAPARSFFPPTAGFPSCAFGKPRRRPIGTPPVLLIFQTAFRIFQKVFRFEPELTLFNLFVTFRRSNLRFAKKFLFFYRTANTFGRICLRCFTIHFLQIMPSPNGIFGLLRFSSVYRFPVGFLRPV